jgi:hypothetical protein
MKQPDWVLKIRWVKKSLKLTLNYLGEWSKFIIIVYHSLVLCFLTTHLSRRMTSKGIETREWKHKVCDYIVWQQKNNGNVTWNNSVFKKKLNAITNSTLKPLMGKEKYIRRAQYILSMRNSDNRGSCGKLTKGIDFFPFKEDLVH